VHCCLRRQQHATHTRGIKPRNFWLGVTPLAAKALALTLTVPRDIRGGGLVFFLIPKQACLHPGFHFGAYISQSSKGNEFTSYQGQTPIPIYSLYPRRRSQAPPAAPLLTLTPPPPSSSSSSSSSSSTSTLRPPSTPASEGPVNPAHSAPFR